MALSPQLQRLQRRMDAIPIAIREAVKPALAKSGDELAGLMEKLAPEDTGALKESIAVTLPGESTPRYSQPGGSRIASETEVLVTVGNEDVRYPHLVEYGTKDVPPHPFFWPAFRFLKRRVENRIKRAIGKAVRENWGGGAQ